MGALWLLVLSTLTAAAGNPLVQGPLLDEELDTLELATDGVLQLDPDLDLGLAGLPVVNGNVDTNDTYDNAVLLALNVGGGYFPFCSGSLIDQRWVLTAAHCLTGLDTYVSYGYSVDILFGTGVGGNFYEAIPAKRWIPNPKYNEQIDDMGLVELQSAKKGVTLMVLNDTPVNDSWRGTVLTHIGYGITSDNADDAGTRRYTDITMGDGGYVADSYYFYSYEPGTNVCSGDSGGPSVHTVNGARTQVGINAFVYGPGPCVNGATGSTRVDRYISWIRGYVPNVITDAGDLPTETDTDTDTDADTDTDTDVDTDSNVTGEFQGEEWDAWGEPGRPEKDTYRKGCSTSGGGAVGLLALVGLLGLRRRSS